MHRRRVGAPLRLGFFVLLTLLVGACTSARSEPNEESDSFTSVENENAEPTTPLVVVYETNTIVCDGLPKPVAEIREAEPGEVLAFTSALPIDLPDAVADRAGVHMVTWSCEPEEARLRWTVTATGQSSKRTATISFNGSSVEEEEPAFAFSPAEDPFVCDGQLKPLGVLSGARPNEDITVQSPHTGSADHRADGLGEVPLWWKCGPDEASTWEVVVDGQGVDRLLRFTVNGVEPNQEDLPALAPELTENPFICDGQSRAFATISNLYPFEPVTFTANTTDQLLSGKANENGILAVRWQCGREDIGTTWDLTATAVDSGRSVTLTFTGGPPDTQATVPLSVTVAEDPFVCDGQSRAFATIGNLLPSEFVDFSSPDAVDLLEGQANDVGLLPVRWQCDAADAGRVWTITATGRSSAKSTTITITGALPS